MRQPDEHAFTGRKRVELFYSTLMKFLTEYSNAIEDFAVAEPLLKGSQLCHKIQVTGVSCRCCC